MLVVSVGNRYTRSANRRKLLRTFLTLNAPRSSGAHMKKIKMKASNVLRLHVVVAALFIGILLPAVAQVGPELQMAELSKKLQLTEEQKKELTPIVAERDRKINALRADTSMGKLQKLRKATELQADFRNQAAKHLNAEQVKKLEALQAERRAKLTGH